MKVMKMQSPRPSREFIDRKEHIEKFWDTYWLFKGNLETIEEIKVINFHGIGGIGKSSLLNHLLKELTSRIQSPLYLEFDFENGPDCITALHRMSEVLTKKYQFKFPMFYIALHTYYERVGQNLNAPELKSIFGSNSVIGDITSLAGAVVPGIGIAATALKLVESIYNKFKINLKNRKRDLFELADLKADKEFIYNRLPYYFAEDLNENLLGKSEPLIVFLDTYEGLVNELHAIGNPHEKDKWLRDPKFGLIPHATRTIWIIAGQNKLKWKEYNPDWQDSLDCRLLGNLSFEDADEFMSKAGIGPAELRSQVWSFSEGYPLCIDLCCENYYCAIDRLTNSGKPIDSVSVTIADVGSDIDEVITNRFVKYMDKDDQDIFMMIACLDIFTRDLLQTLAEKMMINLPFTHIDAIVNNSTILATEDVTGQYTMHNTVKEKLYSICPPDLREKTNEIMEKYLKERLTEISPLDLDFEEHAKRYLTYKLRNIKGNLAFTSFYKKEYRELTNRIKQNNKYAVSCKLDEIMIEFTRNEFGAGVDYAKCLNDYSIRLRLNGQYQAACDKSSIAYQIFSSKYGPEHPETITTKSNLANSLSDAGRWTEALDLRQQVLTQRQRVLGPEHPETITAMNNLAVSLRDAGRRTEALGLRQQVLALRQQVLGPEHPDTITAMNNLAVSLRDEGCWDEAFDLWQQVLALRQQVLGPKHPDTISAIGNLAVSLRDAGRRTVVVNKKSPFLAEKIPYR